MHAKKQTRRRHERGMTLIEIMVVVTIIGLISAGVAVLALEQYEKAQQRRVESDFKAIHNALTLFRVQKGSYPSATEGLKSLVEQRFLQEEPLDPWHHPYTYRLEGGRPIVGCFGADGAPGGEGNDADRQDPPAPGGGTASSR